MKIGRNDPCPCGSGKKYKRCCLRVSGVSRATRIVIPAPLQRPTEPHLIQAKFKGYRFRAVGNRLHYRKPTETFHEFVLAHLKMLLGKAWYMGEVGKPAEERHQIARWYFAVADWQRRMATEENRVPGGWHAEPTGDAQALHALAYDAYTLKHVNRLPRRLLERLKDRVAFQGARYEVAIAAIFVRLGFEIEWINDKTARHYEFIVRGRGLEIAVEAKSRHREGVLHQPGTVDLERAVRGDVDGLFRKALTQNLGDRPFIVFVDLNAPPTPGLQALDKPWLEDLKRMLEGYGTSSAEAPDSYSALAVTNFAYHYVADAISPPGESLLAICRHSTHPLPMEFYDDLFTALTSYGRVPLDPEHALAAAVAEVRRKEAASRSAGPAT